MNPGRLAALCAAGLFLAASAQAQTSLTFYGLVDAHVGAIDNSRGVRNPATGLADPATRGRQYVVNPSGMATSYFGVSGTEDLGRGYKALFALETFFRNDTGALGRFGNGEDLGFTRNAFVGLAGGFGQVTLGRNTAPYFLSAILFNPFVDSFVFSPTIAHVFRGDNNSQGFVQGDTGLSNSIRYTSPTFAGLRADVAYSAASSSVLGQESFAAARFGRTMDAALFYGAGPASATAVYRRIDLANGVVAAGAPRIQDAWLAGAAYDFTVAKVFAQYNDTRDDYRLQADAKKRTWQLGVSVPVGAGRVLASMADSRLSQAGASSRRDTWALGYDYSFSRRTDAYLVYYRDAMKDDVGNTQSVLGLGVRHRF